MITKTLIQAIREQYALNWYGIHGIRHWGRVYSNGLRLAEGTGAKISVVKLFAIFHDSRRLNDGSDTAHGQRGAKLAEDFRGKYFDLSDGDFELLLAACNQHTIAKTHEDITVQTCFDADRLDLARVGKMPDPKYLCTDIAKTPEIIAWANERSLSDYSPDIVTLWNQ
ncbi:MAG: hypothetical protein A2511_03455 [Deltaproteobacteria bacterium RIFOXYD12_FULL_50_9]|nr:MAG: hypothetical protein A2511_03455 [Deltaproteobacteria bacterium RIFOXYD12_FULL_50_9]